MVQADVTPLLAHPLGGQPLAAAPDVLLTRMAHQRLRFPSAHTYFNSGVLLLDLNRWRELELDREALAIMTNPKLQEQLLYPDQDVLNLIGLRYGVQALSTHWNHQLIHGAHASLASSEDPQQAPAIVHFAGEVKPWKSWYPEGPAKQAYWSWREAADRSLGLAEASQLDPPQTARDHWVAFHLLHRQGCYEQASHSAAALLRGLPTPQP